MSQKTYTISSTQSTDGQSGSGPMKILYWPHPTEDPIEEWIDVLAPMIIQFEDLNVLFQYWAKMPIWQQRKVRDCVLTSLEKETLCSTKRNLAMVTQLIESFIWWSEIQDEEGAPGMDADLSLLEGEYEEDLLKAIKTLNTTLNTITKFGLNNRRKSKPEANLGVSVPYPIIELVELEEEESIEDKTTLLPERGPLDLTNHENSSENWAASPPSKLKKKSDSLESL